MRVHDIAVLGGGIIGLSLARALRQRGADVIVIERGEPGGEASSAAAGMLAPVGGDLPPALADFAAHSARLYPAWLEELIDEARHFTVADRFATDPAKLVDMRPQGTVLLGAESRGVLGATELGASELHRIEPALAVAEVPAIFIPEASVDPRGLSPVLLNAAKHVGVDVKHGDAILRLERSTSAWTIVTHHASFHAAKVVDCCGAWSNQVDAFARLPVRPRKGQMLSLVSEGRLPLQHVIRATDVYIVPRSDGRIIIGATVEDVGFDKTVQVEVIERLQRAAERLVPALRHAKRHQHWAGLRPGTPDDLPIMGSLGDGLFVATGHFRNGILLAPATAASMTQIICGESPTLDMNVYAPQRFAAVG